MADTLDANLTARLRKVVEDQLATESELRSLSEKADAWARTLEAQIQGSERRLGKLTADPEAPLSEIATELRRVEALRPELIEIRRLLAQLEERARELRTSWLLHQTESARPSPTDSN